VDQTVNIAVASLSSVGSAAVGHPAIAAIARLARDSCIGAVLSSLWCTDAGRGTLCIARNEQRPVADFMAAPAPARARRKGYSGLCGPARCMAPTGLRCGNCAA
jgi:hypothetical protein